jgi:hypothetical protein
VRVVKADKAYFSPTPGAAHGKAYIVKDDGVGVRATQNGWVQADFVGDTHTASGWLREADLYAPRGSAQAAGGCSTTDASVVSSRKVKVSCR